MDRHRGASPRLWLLAQVSVAGCALLLGSGYLSAQSVAPRFLVGVVADSATGIGLVGAEVALAGTSFTTRSDERGEFRLPDEGAGRRTLFVRRLGFRQVTRELDAGERGAPITVRLAASSQLLAPVQVRAERTKYSGRLAGYYERLERRTNGQFITRVDIERERPAQLTDMLQRSPGVRITRGRPSAQSIRMRGRECRPLVWLDGAPMPSADVDLDSFSPESLEGIELYLGSGNAPLRYQAARGQSECGTILLWSRGVDTEPRRGERNVTPEALEALVAALSVYTSEQVDVTTSLEAAGVWEVPYPSSLRASGMSGTVIAEFVVDTLGRVEADHVGIVSSTHALFSSAVREATRSAEFRPAMHGGRKVRQLVRQAFEFHPLSERR